MKRIFLSLSLGSLLLLFSGCDTLMQIANEAYKVSQQSTAPTQTEVVSGLKEALVQGATNAVSALGAQGGYFNDAALRIPFPPEAQFAADKLRQIGAGALVDEFEKLLNRGAEEGAKQALPIFQAAIRNMSIADAMNILLSNNPRAATDYFDRATRQQLTSTFTPTIKTSLDKVNATKYWSDITTKYNSIPLVQRKVNTDLVGYATQKALDGLFRKIAEEEAKIRQNPVARATALLKKVFAYADQKRSGK